MMQYDLELSLSTFCGCTSILAKNTEIAIFRMFSLVEKVHFIYTTLNPSHTLNPLTHDKILGLPKLKAFADDKLNVTQDIKVFFHRMEKIVEKEENAGN